MSVTGATTRNDYTASSGQTVFPYTFQILLATDLKVLKNGAVLTLNSDYSVSNVGVAGGGNVTLSTGAVSSNTINVFLAMPINRTTQYQNAGDFLAADVNGDLDKSYVAMNQLQTDIQRSIGLKDQDPTVSMELPLASSRVNKYLSFDSAGSPIASSGTPVSGTGFLSVLDFGVVADGSTVNNTTLQTAIDFAVSVNKPLYFPPSSSFIAITEPVYVRSNSHWFGEGEIRNVNQAGNISSSALMPGAFNPVYFRPYNTAVTGYTHYPINAVNGGITITTTTASHAGNFAVGDLVWVSTVTTWVGSAGDYPIVAHLAEVLTVNASTGAITIDNPISERIAALYGSLRVCKAEDSNISDIIGNPLEFCRNATIDGISISAPYGSAIIRGGMYKCDFRFKDIVGMNSIFANAFCSTSVRAQTVTSSRKMCDIAGFSSNFYILIDTAIYDGSNAEADLPAYCRVGECGFGGTIEVINNNCGGYIDPDPLVMIDTSRNVSQIHHMVNAPDHGSETGSGAPFRIQQGVTSNRQIYITAVAWAGSTAYALKDRRINDSGKGYQCITSGTSAGTGGPTGTGSTITDGSVVWKYVTNVAAVGATVLNYGTEFDSQGASKTATKKVYLNNIIVPLGSGAGKYTVTGTNTTITMGTALVDGDRVKIGLDSDYQIKTEDCWMDINAKLGSAPTRAAFINDGAWDASPPTDSVLRRCGFKNLNVTSDGAYTTGTAVTLYGFNSYIDSALCNFGNVSVAAEAKYADIRGYYEDGAINNSASSRVKITSKKGMLCDVGNQLNDQILIQTTSYTSPLIAVFPANSLYIDDRFKITATGRITGTADEKYITFTDNNTTFFTFTIAASATGNFTLEIYLIAQATAQYTAFGVLNLEGSDTVSYATDSSANYTQINTFTVSAKVDNTGDGVRFHNLDSVLIKPYHFN